MEVTVHDGLLSRLEAADLSSPALLVGLLRPDGRPLVLGCLRQHAELVPALPGGVRPLGVAAAAAEPDQLLSAALSLLPEEEEEPAVLLGVRPGRPAVVFTCRDGEPRPAQLTPCTADEVGRWTVLLRLEGALTLRCQPGLQQVREAFERLRRQLDSPTACFVCGDSLLRAAGDQPDPAAPVGRPGLYRLLQQVSGPAGGAPVVQHARGRHQRLQLAVPVAGLAVVWSGAPPAAAAAALRQAALRVLQQTADAVAWVYAEKERLVPVAALHFLPAACAHHLTLVYSDASDEEKLEPVRRDAHAALLLPADRPLFRRANRLSFAAESPYLRDVHLGLPAPAAGQVALVRGSYAYHHYMQDRTDDSGWGCAYRSLQTLASWFQVQGYTERAPPSHRQIQQCLVDMGDKPAAFVGSRQWIGSTEVSYCLRQLLDVESKILHVSSGAELVSQGRALLRHFSEEGTPVMIGGGVLAHTLLGVAFDEAAGETQFLVLDPHYTGAENLATIQAKGWCGWKDGQFWDQTAYYNLCMPIRPHCV